MKYIFVAINSSEECEFIRKLNAEAEKQDKDNYCIKHIQYFRHTDNYTECWGWEAILTFEKKAGYL